ncbi:hypothetical protein VOLCADRAFT_97118 [Volvox carteri f. nagariensis]|uniref:PsbP C-terminal domain-containing protein n=1 Tax=Volvox carteri f. nagariensis TaxID=3068 RepID=D8UBX9_VOLCA|nr:uncharacterized protein VOLCADRAFT_97118 [Volvox carteri f. nagariensis]EFJ42751.1 hypothetical protein VOLCADRAFT_97118 [Volvox carteri f. nagariensis]|eukprot:XP_002956212.1 hypothetical protein VOLCADRAFT_97118 [Volvox carteri f. nagariensis]
MTHHNNRTVKMLHELSTLEGATSVLSRYTDPQDGFTLAVPPGWVFGEGELPGNSSFSGASGARRTLVWIPEGANPRDVNVTLVITNVSVVAKLVDATELSGRYFVEYTVQKLPEPQRHLYSLLALGYNGMYNRLYTITAQTLEGDRPQYEAALLSMVKSLSVPPQRICVLCHYKTQRLHHSPSAWGLIAGSAPALQHPACTAHAQ